MAQKILKQIVDIQSVSGSEEQLASWIENYIGNFKYLDCTRYGNCIVAKTNFGREKRVALAGHIDTVPISHKTNNFPSKVEGDYLWGRGTVDMKAGDAVMLKLMEKVQKPKYDITYIFYDNEEVAASKNGLGILAREHFSEIEADAAVLLEPTDNYVELGCNGTLRFDLVVTGKTAHSARPFFGENAIHKVEKVLQVLNKWNEGELKIVTIDQMKYIESLNAVKISGGIATNMIADEVKIHTNFRFAPSRKASEAKEYVRSLFEGIEEVNHIDFTDESEGALPGLNCTLISEFIEVVKSSELEMPQGEPIMRAKLGWTDVARFTSLGIPALNFAPGDPNLCHADDEKVKLEQVDQCLAVFEKFFR
jgi:succinyl-diaminopimelate desuccinylase